MVRGAARLDLSKTQVLSAAQAKFVEKLQQKLGFYRKLRAFQKQGKKKRASIKKFAKKHRFSCSSVWKALPFAKERLARLEQRLETLQKAAKTQKINGSAIHRSFKRPKCTVRSINKLLSCERLRKKLENSRYWREIQEQMTRDEGRIELTNSEWIQWFEELHRIDKAVEENMHIPKRELTFFQNEPWVNVLFGRKP
jgi:hypothetical protein